MPKKTHAEANATKRQSRAPSLIILNPIFATYDARKREAERHTPGGVLLEADLIGLRKRVASIHKITPEDLKRWVELYHVEGLVDG